MKTVYVLEDLVDENTLDALRNECDIHFQRQSTTIDAEQERSCSIDLFEDASLSDGHAARTNSDEYLSVRWREVKPSTQAHCDCIRQFLFHSAPMQLRKLLPHVYSKDIYLFNENYIVKSGDSSLEFRWHTDEDEQFKCHIMLLQQEDDIPNNDGCTNNDRFCKEYYSLWIPLDDCNKNNGTIVFQGTTKVVNSQSRDKEINDHCNNSCSKISNNDDDVHGSGGGREETVDIANHTSVYSVDTHLSTTGEELIMNISAGSGVLFSSRLLHRSGPNKTSKERRVLYVQYTGEVITGLLEEDCLEKATGDKRKFVKLEDEDEIVAESNKGRTPLSFAVKCLHK